MAGIFLLYFERKRCENAEKILFRPSNGVQSTYLLVKIHHPQALLCIWFDAVSDKAMVEVLKTVYRVKLTSWDSLLG